ncbi:glycosyltransferase [Acinetobacter junii]|uniref:glycosyltransferase n=1 Tax=Acinetobacter junii TaxID=40215 RepID=UPI003862793D
MSFYYIGYYTKNGNPNNFLEFPGCSNKMSYIINCMKINNIAINVICLGESKDSRNYKSKEVKVDSLENNFFIGTIKYRIFSRLYLYFQLIYILLFRVKRTDTVIFYHSYYLLFLFKFFKKIKNFNLIIEVEESYMAAWGKSDFEIINEIKSLKGADAYIYVNDLLPDIIEKTKPYVVCYGDYHIKSILPIKISGERKKIVYAGLISEKDDSDIYLAVNAMKYLDNSYSLSILGYGSDCALKKLKQYIVENNLSNNVVYEGFLKGEAYINFLQNCDFAINPRVLSDRLSDYTFPSKVLAYLSVGLPVVSTPIRCIKESKVSGLVSFSESTDPLSFSNAIKSLNLNTNPTSTIVSLDKAFIVDLRRLLENVAS